MKVFKIVVLISMVFFLSSCFEQVEPTPLCQSPLIEFEPGKCCQDTNNNQVCDVQEIKPKPRNTQQIITQKSETPKSDELSKTVDEFKRLFNNEDFSNLYDLFIPALQARKSKDAFQRRMAFEYAGNIEKIELQRLERVNSSLAFATFEILVGTEDQIVQKIQFELVGSHWKANAFAPIFRGPCGNSVCSMRESDLACGVLDCINKTVMVHERSRNKVTLHDKEYSIFFYRSYPYRATTAVDIGINNATYTNITRRKGQNVTIATINNIRFDYKGLFAKFNKKSDAVRIHVYTPVVPLKNSSVI